MATLSEELQALQEEIEGHARSYGLDFFPVIFEILDYRSLNQVAAFGGFPTRYPHWRFGMEYEYLTKSYSYGLSKIYEMVINNDPCYAYLLECNARVDQKLVMAHVYGHNDFFKNNIWFSRTNRKMMDETANHGNRIRAPWLAISSIILRVVCVKYELFLKKSQWPYTWAMTSFWSTVWLQRIR